MPTERTDGILGKSPTTRSTLLDATPAVLGGTPGATAGFPCRREWKSRLCLHMQIIVFIPIVSRDTSVSAVARDVSATSSDPLGNCAGRAKRPGLFTHADMRALPKAAQDVISAATNQRAAGRLRRGGRGFAQEPRICVWGETIATTVCHAYFPEKIFEDGGFEVLPCRRPSAVSLQLACNMRVRQRFCHVALLVAPCAIYLSRQLFALTLPACGLHREIARREHSDRFPTGKIWLSTETDVTGTVRQVLNNNDSTMTQFGKTTKILTL